MNQLDKRLKTRDEYVHKSYIFDNGALFADIQEVPLSYLINFREHKHIFSIFYQFSRLDGAGS